MLTQVTQLFMTEVPMFTYYPVYSHWLREGRQQRSQVDEWLVQPDAPPGGVAEEGTRATDWPTDQGEEVKLMILLLYLPYQLQGNQETQELEKDYEEQTEHK